MDFQKCAIMSGFRRSGHKYAWAAYLLLHYSFLFWRVLQITNTIRVVDGWRGYQQSNYCWARLNIDKVNNASVTPDKLIYKHSCLVAL